MKRKIAQAVRIVGLALSIPPFSITLKLAKRLQRKWVIPALAGMVVVYLFYAGNAIRKSNTTDHELESLRTEVYQLKKQLDTSQAEQIQVRQTVAILQSAEKANKEQFASFTKPFGKSGQEAKGGEISDSQLNQRIIALVKQLREMHAKQSQEKLAYFNAFSISARGTTVDQMRQLAQQHSEQTGSLCRTHDLELQSYTLGEMLYIQEELKRRLPDLQVPEIEVRIALTGHLTGVDPLMEVANYFEIAGKKLMAKTVHVQTMAQLSLR